MKYLIISLLVFAVLPAVMATDLKVNDDGFTVEGVQIGVRATQDSRALRFFTEYDQVFIYVDDCKTLDIWRLCVEHILYEPITFWPHNFSANITYSRTCDADECVGWGMSCDGTVECSGECVHNVCRPKDPWCGDGFCDVNEFCSIDCEEPEPEPILAPEVVQEEDVEPIPEPVVEEVVEEVVEDVVPVVANETPEPVEPKPIAVEQARAPLIESTSANEPNYFAAALTVGIGLVLLILVIIRGRRQRSDVL